MSEKLFKKDLAEKLADEKNITKKEATEIIDFLSNTIVDQLANGNSVTIKELGKFSVIEKKARVGINPKTLEKVEIKAKKSISFKASKSLKEIIE